MLHCFQKLDMAFDPHTSHRSGIEHVLYFSEKQVRNSLDFPRSLNQINTPIFNMAPQTSKTLEPQAKDELSQKVAGQSMLETVTESTSNKTELVLETVTDKCERGTEEAQATDTGMKPKIGISQENKDSDMSSEEPPIPPMRRKKHSQTSPPSSNETEGQSAKVSSQRSEDQEDKNEQNLDKEKDDLKSDLIDKMTELSISTTSKSCTVHQVTQQISSLRITEKVERRAENQTEAHLVETTVREGGKVKNHKLFTKCEDIPDQLGDEKRKNRKLFSNDLDNRISAESKSKKDADNKTAGLTAHGLCGGRGTRYTDSHGRQVPGQFVQSYQSSELSLYSRVQTENSKRGLEDDQEVFLTKGMRPNVNIPSVVESAQMSGTHFRSRQFTSGGSVIETDQPQTVQGVSVPIQSMQDPSTPDVMINLFDTGMFGPPFNEHKQEQQPSRTHLDSTGRSESSYSPYSTPENSPESAIDASPQSNDPELHTYGYNGRYSPIRSEGTRPLCHYSECMPDSTSFGYPNKASPAAAAESRPACPYSPYYGPQPDSRTVPSPASSLSTICPSPDQRGNTNPYSPYSQVSSPGSGLDEKLERDEVDWALIEQIMQRDLKEIDEKEMKKKQMASQSQCNEVKPTVHLPTSTTEGAPQQNGPRTCQQGPQAVEGRPATQASLQQQSLAAGSHHSQNVVVSQTAPQFCSVTAVPTLPPLYQFSFVQATPVRPQGKPKLQKILPKGPLPGAKADSQSEGSSVSSRGGAAAAAAVGAGPPKQVLTFPAPQIIMTKGGLQLVPVLTSNVVQVMPAPTLPPPTTTIPAQQPSTVPQNQPTQVPRASANSQQRAPLSPPMLQAARTTVAKQKTEVLIKGDEDGYNSLHIQSEKDSERDYFMLRAILERLYREFSEKHFQTVLNSKTKNGETPLFMATKMKLVKVVELLVGFGADVSILVREAKSIEPRWLSALHYTSCYGQAYLPVLKALLQSPFVDLTQQNTDGLAPLHCALASHGKILNNSESGGDAAIDSWPVVVELLNKGADPTEYDNRSRRAPLTYAIETRDVSLVQKFLEFVEKRSDGREVVSQMIRYRQPNGNSALHIAAQAPLNDVQDHKRLLHLLLTRGADLAIRNNENERPYDVVFNGNPEIIRCLKGQSQRSPPHN